MWKGTVQGLASLGNLYHWERVLRAVVQGSQERSVTFLMRYCFQAVIYALWHERNVRRVGESAQPAMCLTVRLDKIIRNIVSSLRSKANGRHEKTMQIWFDRSF